MHSTPSAILVFMGHALSLSTGLLAHGLVRVILVYLPLSITIFLPSSLICPLPREMAPRPATSSTRVNPFLSNSPRKQGLPARPTDGGGLSFKRIALKALPVCVKRNTFG